MQEEIGQLKDHNHELNDGERSKIMGALRIWSELVPDVPIAGFINRKLLTPTEIINAIEQGTEDGNSFMEMLAHGVRVEGIDSVVERLTRRAPKPE